jgi:hypothetical protein
VASLILSNRNNSQYSLNSILWSEKPPKGFEKFFPKADKTQNKSEDKLPNPFDFKKFTSNKDGGGNEEKSGDNKQVFFFLG